jgi:hypothetical protein
METTYMYREMPFGLSHDPQVFTQIMKKCAMAVVIYFFTKTENI